ncbi:N-acetylglucosamine-6-phosphate deacetylase [Edaphosphingomonas haloaromaticamans]|uniref:N-acetylglucosamine-6-phosphate deacetylase n=1 Tax=Edaphosphingomonas haloaromaticamans TaxID=653954 RepID=A0A1S1HGP8_9SPHN|nr:N-acetylglucosamine-6-phosphate deacetylase [Sphingomonas haloaromaticamans]OHT20661.1 N-acetylglucosamine-6-phosphate deacetylase [Sphingomonas haloaromaticamans]
MTVALVNGRILIDSAFVGGQAVLVEAGRIAAIVAEGDVPDDVERHDLAGQRLAPGYIDLQVNGGGGVLFNDMPTVEGIAAIGAAHRRYGTTGFLPTLISDDLSVVRAGVAAVEAAIAAGVPGVLGIHIEGPFLNVARKGIHNPAKIRALDEDGIAAVTGLRHGRTLVTLAPEKTTPAIVRRLVEAGVVVAAGHTAGTYRQIRDALDQGMSGFTHLFNAMSPLTSREPGAVGAALEDEAAWCGLIVDGRHVDPVTMRLALRCKPADRFALVTDAMPTVGMAEKSFVLQGHRITVVDGVCVNEDGTLAGSDLDMARAVRNAVAMLDIGAETAIGMASDTPARFLGVAADRGRIAPGLAADFVLLDDALNVAGTWIAGAFEAA